MDNNNQQYNKLNNCNHDELLQNVLKEMNIIVNKIKTIKQFIRKWKLKATPSEKEELYLDNKPIEDVYTYLKSKNYQFDVNGNLISDFNTSQL